MGLSCEDCDLSWEWMDALIVVPDRAVGGRGAVEAIEFVDSSVSNRFIVGRSGRSGRSPAPAAAIICGLRGLEDELARLPFLEC